MVKEKKKNKKVNPFELPEIPDPLDDVKKPNIKPKYEIPDPLDDVK